MLSIIVIAIAPSRNSVVAAFLLFGLRNAGTPLEIASTPVSAAQPDEKARASRKIIAAWEMSPLVAGCRVDDLVGTLHVGQGALGGADGAVHRHPDDAEHEAVGGDREERARLPDAAQVQGGEHHHHHDRHGRLVPGERRDGRGGVLHARGHRHRDRQHVVDEQRGRDGHAGVLAEVDLGDLVVAAAAGVGVHVLAVRRHHGQHHHGDGQADLPAVDVRRGARDREHDEDLVRRVGHRGQRVAGEDR